MSRYPEPFLFSPINKSKYVGDVTKIVIRSQLEMRFAMWCDRTPAIKQWASEELVVPYKSPIDNKIHRYFVDFWMVTQNERGEHEKWWVEIKPKVETMPPAMPKKMTEKGRRNLQEATMTYYVNQAKWQSATSYAQKHAARFIVITDEDLR
jgi:hypothetical protein